MKKRASERNGMAMREHSTHTHTHTLTNTYIQERLTEMIGNNGGENMVTMIRVDVWFYNTDRQTERQCIFHQLPLSLANELFTIPRDHDRDRSPAPLHPDRSCPLLLRYLCLWQIRHPSVVALRPEPPSSSSHRPGYP